MPSKLSERLMSAYMGGKQESKIMNKQSALEEIYQSAFEDEIEKVATGLKPETIIKAIGSRFKSLNRTKPNAKEIMRDLRSFPIEDLPGEARHIQKYFPKKSFNTIQTKEYKIMNKQSALDQIKQAAFEGELEKVALSSKTLIGVAKKLDPMMAKAMKTITKIQNTPYTRKLNRDILRDRLFVKQDLKRLGKKIDSNLLKSTLL